MLILKFYLFIYIPKDKQKVNSSLAILIQNMEQEAGNKMLNDDRVINFVTRAAEYTTFVENTSNFSKKDFIWKALLLLSDLYHLMLSLPPVENATDSTNEKFVTDEAWHSIYHKVSKKLGYHNDYVDIFDPVSKEEEDVSVVSLGDNLADIYQDIKDFVTLYSMGNDEVMIDALWECQMNFEEYWGHKALNALRVLHRIYFGDENLEDRPEEDESKTDERNNWLFNKKREQYKNRNGQ